MGTPDSGKRPDFQLFWALLQLARGTSTKSPTAASQNNWNFRSYESILIAVGIILGGRYLSSAIQRETQITDSLASKPLY